MDSHAKSKGCYQYSNKTTSLCEIFHHLFFTLLFRAAVIHSNVKYQILPKIILKGSMELSALPVCLAKYNQFRSLLPMLLNVSEKPVELWVRVFCQSASDWVLNVCSFGRNLDCVDIGHSQWLEDGFLDLWWGGCSQSSHWHRAWN